MGLSQRTKLKMEVGGEALPMKANDRSLRPYLCLVECGPCQHSSFMRMDHAGYCFPPSPCSPSLQRSHSSVSSRGFNNSLMMDSEMLFRCGVGRELTWCFRNDHESLMGKTSAKPLDPSVFRPPCYFCFILSGWAESHLNSATG